MLACQHEKCFDKSHSGDMSDIHERLRTARESAGFSSASAAARYLGIAPSTYTAHENGQNKYNHDEAVRYAKAFKTTAKWLLFEEGELATPGIDEALRGLPANQSQALIEKFNAMIEGVKTVGKLK
jgi:transcriptional regulator with XRE-family HTH domain